MQWKCPNCASILAVPQNALVSGWSFSRCYKCAGFSLVRKSEISVVKLDSAPPGVQGILSEASSDLSIHLPSQEPRIVSATAITGGIPAPLPELPTHTFKHTLSGRSFWRSSIGTLPAALLVIMVGIALLQYKPHATAQISTLQTLPGQTSPAQTVPSNQLQAAVVEHAPFDQKTVISDQIKEKAMAPIPKLPIIPSYDEKAAEKIEDSNPIKPLLSVEIKTKKAKIRLGPGIEFPVIAMADSAEFYDVVDWNDRWFKVVIPNSSEMFGWIRNDLVQVKTKAH